MSLDVLSLMADNVDGLSNNKSNWDGCGRSVDNIDNFGRCKNNGKEFDRAFNNCGNFKSNKINEQSLCGEEEDGANIRDNEDNRNDLLLQKGQQKLHRQC